MARRGGLGKGLDALIPDRSGKREKSHVKKPEENPIKRDSEDFEETDVEYAEDETSSYNPFEIDVNSMYTDEPGEDDLPASVNTEESYEDSEVEAESSSQEKNLEETDEHDYEKEREEITASEHVPVVPETADEGKQISSTVENDKNLGLPKEEKKEKEDFLSKDDEPQSTALHHEIHKESVVSVKISQVEPNRGQPRKYFDDAAIEELADSIRQFGIISPLLVQKKDNYFEIIAGERRWRAAQKAGLKEVPVIIKDFTSQQAVEVSLIENIQREDLNPIEEAKAYDRLLSEYGLNQEEIAERVSKSRSAVANSMRLLKLDMEVQKLVEMGVITEGHARALLGIQNPEIQRKAAQQVIDSKLSVRQTERLVKELTKPQTSTKKEINPEKEAQLTGLAENLKTTLGTKVVIHQSGKNKGKIEIEYYSDVELERIYSLLQSVR